MEFLYVDRVEAGMTLARELGDITGAGSLVLAIPRGGVVVGYEVAKALGAELDIVAPRKLGAPNNPELALGAVMHDGSRVLNEDVLAIFDVPPRYLEEEAAQQVAEAQRRMRLYRGDRPYPNLGNRAIIIVDDGLATGATMAAALRWARTKEPKLLIGASPVGSIESVRKLEALADRVICPHTPEPFFAIGQFYREFEAVEDEDVKALLEKTWRIP